MEWMVDSSAFARGERSAMGLYDECWFGSLLGLRMGMILAIFQFVGIVFVFTILLNNLVIQDMVK